MSVGGRASLADPESWRRGASRKFYVAVELDGAVEGYAYYRVKDEWEDGFPKGEVRVIEALATSVQAERTLWSFLHGIDLVVRVAVPIFDPGSALPLLVRDPRALGLRVGDGLWLRLVDVDAALPRPLVQARRIGGARGADELCPWNAGRYRVGDDAGRTEDTADLALDVTDLASAYLGGFNFHRLARAGLVEERVEGSVEAATISSDGHATLLPGGVLNGLGCPADQGSRGVQGRCRRDLHFFGGGPDDERAERFAKVLPLERMHAAFDGDAVVGGAGAFPFQLTVPGGVVPAVV